MTPDYARLSAPAEHQGVLIEPDFPALLSSLQDLESPIDPRPLLDSTFGACRARLRERLALTASGAHQPAHDAKAGEGACGPGEGAYGADESASGPVSSVEPPRPTAPNSVGPPRPTEGRRGRLRSTGRPPPTPVIVTGHQADFLHAGVFAKTLAVDLLAAATDGQAVFITADSDTPRSRVLQVPITRRGRVRLAPVAWPACDLNAPLETQPRASAAEWDVFFDQVARLYPAPSLLDVFRDGWSTGLARGDVSDAFWHGQQAAAQASGAGRLRHLRMSRLAETPEFRAFVAAILLRAAEFARHYNAAQAECRRRRRIRNPQRPAPLLRIEPERVETPFWIFREREPRRRLYVRLDRESIELFAESAAIGRMPRSAIDSIAANELPWSIHDAGWRIRPRALTLSAFARLLLGDLFVHGIGGAKYDEMTDAFVGAFFGAPPAPNACVTATLRLPLPAASDCPPRLAAARRRLRDVRYNPDRYLANALPELLERRARLIAETKRLGAQRRAAWPDRVRMDADRQRRHEVYLDLRAVNERLCATAPEEIARLARECAALQESAAGNTIALSREHFFALHDPAALRELRERIRAALPGAARRRASEAEAGAVRRS